MPGTGASSAPDRPVPGREAPLRRHAGRAGAGAGGGLDAAAALDGDPGGDDTALALAAAGAVAFEAHAAAAKDRIQVLGGIGFTWEHDAHLYLRRALALRQLFGGAGPWRAAAARAALAGVRRHLAVDLPAGAEALRAEVRATVEAVAALPADQRRSRLADAGLLVPHWALPWGRDAGAVEQVVIDQELRRAGVRVPHLMVGAWAAPTIAVHGTPEQQERGWGRRCAARSPGASCSASRRRARTWRR